MSLPSQRHLFSIPDDACYMNTAYMGPLLRSAEAVGHSAVTAKTRPWIITPADFFPDVEASRALFGRIINCPADDVAIVPSVSYGIAVAAANLEVGPGKTVVVLEDQFPSNIYSWRRLINEGGGELITVARPKNGDWTPALLAEIDDRTAVVAACHCHWTDGSLVDLARIGERCRAVGAALVIDGTQSIGVLPFDVEEIQPDFLVVGTYKWLLGPYGYGLLYLAPQHQQGRPLEEDWINRADAQDFSGLVNYTDAYAPGARRFDMGGKSNFFNTPIAVDSLQQMLEWGVTEIASTLAAITGQIAARAREMGLIIPPDELRAGHLLGLRFPDGVPAGLLDRLAEARVFVSVRGDSVRVAPHMHTTPADIDRLLSVLGEALG